MINLALCGVENTRANLLKEERLVKRMQVLMDMAWLNSMGKKKLKDFFIAVAIQDSVSLKRL